MQSGCSLAYDLHFRKKLSATIKVQINFQHLNDDPLIITLAININCVIFTGNGIIFDSFQQRLCRYFAHLKTWIIFGSKIRFNNNTYQIIIKPCKCNILWYSNSCLLQFIHTHYSANIIHGKNPIRPGQLSIIFGEIFYHLIHHCLYISPILFFTFWKLIYHHYSVSINSGSKGAMVKFPV